MNGPNARGPCAALLALLVLAASSPAQAFRNLSGFYAGEPGAHPLAVESGPQTVEPLGPALPFLIPKWDGRDDAGNVHPWTDLRGVVLSVRHTLEVEGRGENASATATGLWQVEVGSRSYFARQPIADLAPDPATAWGGSGFNAYLAGSHGLAGFDGTLDGLGASGWTESSTGTPFAFEFLDIGANREDLRAWCGGGDVLVFWLPRQQVVDHGFPGHWRDWSTARVRVLDVAPGAQIQVRYVLGPPPVTGPFRIERGPWIDFGLFRPGEEPVSDLPGMVGDPTKLLGTWIELAQEDGRSIGIENTAAFSATCGGTSSGGIRLFDAQGPIPSLWSNSSANVGSFSPLEAWDGSTDWQGASGLETWQGASWTGIWRSPLLEGHGIDAQIRAVVTHATIAPESLTPGAVFAWWGAYRFTARARASRLVRP